MSKQIAAYGSWASPISAETLSSANVGLSEIHVKDGALYWLESRPQEKGRTTIIQQSADGQRKELLPPPFNARSRVNEYGGGSYCILDGRACFVNFEDQRIHSVDIHGAGAAPQPITADGPWRYGNLLPDPTRNRLIAVCEDHQDENQEEETFIASVEIGDEEKPKKLLSGRDFYASPALSPDGKYMAWLCWDHPNMPWDGCECWLGEFDAQGNIINARLVAGGVDESIFQPQWSPDGSLYLISDRSNWWNIYRLGDNELLPVHAAAMEFGTPQWVFGLSTYAFLDANRLLTTYTQQGIWRLGIIHLRDGSLQTIDTPCSDFSYVRAANGEGYCIGAAGDGFPALLKLQADGRLQTLVSSGTLPAAADYISHAEAITFPLRGGKQKGHAFFYPPRNKDFHGPEGSKPPLLVLCHGGPTSATRNSLNLRIQYWTSRGFAVADVNYGGSTGFGREYRDRLKGQWGIVDVQDAVDCVEFLAETGRIDDGKVAIRGSSAGGYTTLAALTFEDVFRAGASLYGIGDLETLARDTHKFESRYLDQLVGPYPAQQDLYRARSPIHHVDQLDCPVIFLQGLQDKIVPPNQAEAMVDALDKKKLPVAYVTFDNEAHGFRQAASIVRAQEAELYFYSRVFGFELADAIEPVEIRNEELLPTAGE